MYKHLSVMLNKIKVMNSLFALVFVYVDSDFSCPSRSIKCLLGFFSLCFQASHLSLSLIRYFHSSISPLLCCVRMLKMENSCPAHGFPSVLLFLEDSLV